MTVDYTIDQYIRAYGALRDVATRQETIGYQQLSDRAFLGMDMMLTNDRRRIGRLLGAISSREHSAGRPMLSAVVVLVKETPLNPGKGFFECAIAIGKLATSASQQPFFQSELQAVHRYWEV